MKRILLGLLLAILTLLSATGIGLGLIHVSDFPYTADIKNLGIEESSGLPLEEIKANYDAVMDFLSPFSKNEFHLPTMKYSETGAQHFVDCKLIFNAVYILSLVSIIGFSVLLATRAADRTTLKYSGIITLAIPALLGLFMTLDFDETFRLFHAVFFDGDTWIFDPKYDEIINILPSEFFMHCAIFIAAFWVIAAVAEIIIGASGTKVKNAAS